MKGKVTIELSNDLYQKFLELKKTISSMTKSDISDEELMWFMVQEISIGVEMMNSGNWNNEGHQCCGWHHHEDAGHKCCGGGHCGH